MSKERKLVAGMVINCDGCKTELKVGSDKIHPQVYGNFCSDCTKTYSEYEVDLRKFYFKWDMERAKYIDQIKDLHFKKRKQAANGTAVNETVAPVEAPIEVAKINLAPEAEKPKPRIKKHVTPEGLATDASIAELEAEVRGVQLPA